MDKTAYRYQWMPKIVTSGSFDVDYGFFGALIVDDPDVLKKTAGSKVVDEWGDIEPIKGHTLVHVIAMGATETTGPNRNGDGWKAAFLQSAHPTFVKHGALYRDHKSKDYSKRSGDILKSAWNDDMGRVELLFAANNDKCADFLQDIDHGRRRDVSMGFDCHHDVCSICKHAAKTKKEYCQHTKKGAKAPFGLGRILEDGRKIYVDNPEGYFNDISMVPVGADMIAQNLRKVGSLDEDDILSGAELAEVYMKEAGIDTVVKIAIAHKLSRMEKIVPAVMVRPDKDLKLNPTVVSKLRSAEPQEMFRELSKVGSVLDFRSFFQLTMGDKFAEIESYVDRAEVCLDGLFGNIANDSDRLDRVCRNSCYDSSKYASGLLSDFDRAMIASEFSIDPDIATERLVHRAIGGSGVLVMQKDAGDLNSPATRFLHDEYAAYKLAALEAVNLELTDAVIIAAVMTS